MLRNFDYRHGQRRDRQAAAVGRIQAEDVILSVTGGSSRFQNVRGQATAAFTGPREITITYDLIP